MLQPQQQHIQMPVVLRPWQGTFVPARRARRFGSRRVDGATLLAFALLAMSILLCAWIAVERGAVYR